MKYCTLCKAKYDDSVSFCTIDGEVLEADPSSLVDTVLDGQYQMEACLGRVEWAPCIVVDTSSLVIVWLSKCYHLRCVQTPNGFVASVEKDKPRVGFDIPMQLQFTICGPRRTAPFTW
jgi:hypothetical protein